MITHIVAWNFSNELTDAQKKAYGLQLQKEFAELINTVPSLTSITFTCNLEASSTRQAMLFTTFDNIAGLDAYQAHPEHLKVAELVRKIMIERVCLDFDPTFS